MACPGKNCCLDVIYTTLSDLCHISYSQGGIPRELRSEKRHYGKKLEEFVCPGSGFATKIPFTFTSSQSTVNCYQVQHVADHCTTHLSKWPSDLKINGTTQQNVTFSGQVLHGLSCGVFLFAASVTFKNHPLNGCNFSTANQVLLFYGF